MKKLLPIIILIAAGTQALAQNTGIGTITPTDQLHTTGTVRFQGYSGAGTRLLYLDSTGRITATGGGPVFTNSTQAAIVDNGCAAGNGASTSIAVTGLPAAVASSKIAVRLNISHLFLGDLKVLLVAPNGNVLALAINNGGSGHNYTNTVFSDAAINTLSAGTPPYTDKFKPAGGTGVAQCLITPTVNTFSGIGGGAIVPNGTWTLKVYDSDPVVAGTLDSWQISFSGPESFGTQDENGKVPYFAAGALVPSSITALANGNIGIGNTAPAARLDIAGTLRIADGTQGVGKVLVSSATGAASWQPNAPLNSSFLASINFPVTINSAGLTPVVLPFTVTPGTLPTYDDAAAFGTAGPGIFTAPATGVYHFDVGVGFNPTTATAAGNITVVAVLNGSTQLQQSQRVFEAGAKTPINNQFSFTCKLVAGNTLKMGLVVVGISSTQVYNTTDSYFSGYRIY